MMRELVQRLGRAIGLDIRRATAISDPTFWLLGMARSKGADTILDIGANVGQFATSVIHAGWSGPIFSFEPLSSAHLRLTRAAERHDEWTVMPRCAVGAQRETVEINIAGNSESSSLLPMLNRHVQAAPSSNYTGSERVEVLPLDEADLPGNARFLMKIDVQGFEKQVLDGATSVLNRTPIIHTEMSLQALYDGETLFTDLSAHIMTLGYECVGIRPAYFDDTSGEILQVDGTFARRS